MCVWVWLCAIDGKIDVHALFSFILFLLREMKCKNGKQANDIVWNVCVCLVYIFIPVIVIFHTYIMSYLLYLWLLNRSFSEIQMKNTHKNLHLIWFLWVSTISALHTHSLKRTISNILCLKIEKKLITYFDM